MKDMDLEGTTAIGILYADGAILAVDSRSSNLTQKPELLQKSGYVPIIDDDAIKFYNVTNQIACIMVGNRTRSLKMKRDISDKCKNAETVIEVYDSVKVYLNNNRHKNKGYGIIISGFDYEGFHIHAILVDDETQLLERKNLPFVSLGSGGSYAKEIVEAVLNTQTANTSEEIEIYSKFSLDAGAMTMLRALFHSTYNDKATGGCLNVYYINHIGHAWENESKVYLLDAYVQFYDLYEEGNTLLAIFQGSNAVNGEDLTVFFSEYAEAKQSHCIAFMKSNQQADQKLYIHRFVFKTTEAAANVYSYVEQVGIHHNIDSPTILTEFPWYVLIKVGDKELSLYVSKCSKALVQALAKFFQGQVKTAPTTNQDRQS